MAEWHQVTIEISDEMYQAVEKESRRTRLSRAGVIRAAVAEWLRLHPNPEIERMKEKLRQVTPDHVDDPRVGKERK